MPVRPNAQNDPDTYREELKRAYQAASEELWRTAEAEDWSIVDTEDWPDEPAAAER